MMSDQELRRILSVNIRRYRGCRNLTQAEFAEKINISIPFLSDIENGKKWVSPQTLAKMADALETEVYELLRPETSLPDGAKHLIDRYSADIQQLFTRNLEDLRAAYMADLADRD